MGIIVDTYTQPITVISNAICKKRHYAISVNQHQVEIILTAIELLCKEEVISNKKLSVPITVNKDGK